MRLTLFTATACVLTVIALAIQGGRQSTGATASPGTEVKKASEPAGAPATLAGKLIVHEWGTFTSFSGSDGIRLEFRPLADEDLPPFVLDRFLQAGVPNFSKSQIRVRMRMETPVTYFYTDRERDLEVKVAFPEGLLTEFYPPVESMQPDFNLGERPPIKDSLLDWGRIHLIPTDRLQAQVDDPVRRQLLESRMAAGLLPQADTNNHYFHARETDSAIVEVRRSKHELKEPFAPQGEFFEKFLFYRGVGNFELPLKLTCLSDGQFELVNSGADAFDSLFLVDIVGEQVRFSQVDQIPANGRLVLMQSTESTTTDKLEASIVAALVGHGLYEKEARAMVNTWKSSWFGEQGTRLLYAVPQSITDKLLPLSISPPPDQTIRVLIGRLEIMTSADEARVTKLVRSSASARKAAIIVANQAGKPFEFAWPAELKRLGRLVEPALVRVSKVSEDPTVRLEARMLLKTLDQRE
ncbi:MAG: hypothetical protein WD648_02250 [Planctomycetaceae bacterium]